VYNGFSPFPLAWLGEMRGYQCLFGTETYKDKIYNATIGIHMGMSTQNNQKKGTKKAALARYLYMQNCK
jgi:hypothetical protein